MKTLFIYLGRLAISFKNDFINVFKMIKNFGYWTFAAPFKGKGLRLKETLNQIVIIGYQAVRRLNLACY